MGWGCYQFMGDGTLILSVLSPSTHWNEAFQIVPEKHPTVDQPTFQPLVDT